MITKFLIKLIKVIVIIKDNLANFFHRLLKFRSCKVNHYEENTCEKKLRP